MKKVLLTNFNMVNYSGSELDTLTIANYFLSLKYEVTIFTLETNFPLLNEIDERIKIIECIDIDRLENYYDLIWAHHYPLLDYLIFEKKITAGYIAYLSLSSYEPYEAIPPYYQKLNYVSILSQEGMDVIKEDGYNIDQINILGNYSFKKYFDNRKKKLNNNIKNICVISNHVPDEIVKFKEIAKANDIIVDMFGMQFKYIKVDDKLLKKYDVIITIGKTVNYGLSLGIPVYCYDRFGGDGYITKKNIKKSHDYNFSGRYSKIKLTADKLYEDVINNYKKAISDANLNYNYALENFCFEKQLEKVLKKIYSTKKVDLDDLRKEYKLYGKTSSLFMREIRKMQLKNNNSCNGSITCCKFYFDCGKGFNEENSKIFYYKKRDDIYIVNIDIKSNIKRLRFDFVDKMFVKIDYIKVNGQKLNLENLCNVLKLHNEYISLNDDPYIIMDNIQSENLEIETKMILNSHQKIMECYSNLNSENISLKNKLSLIKNSRWYKIIVKLRALIGKAEI